MASSILVVVLFLVLGSLSLTCGYSPPSRDAIFKQDDESYFMATSDQGALMIDVEDLAKVRSLGALVAGSKVVVNKASRSSSSKSSKKKKHKSNIIGSLDVAALVGIIIAAIVVTIVIICVICYFISLYKTKKALSTGQGKVKGSPGTSKSEDRV